MCAIVIGASPVISILMLQACTKEGEKPDANSSDIA